MEIRKAKASDCTELTELRIKMRKERESLENVNQKIFYDNTLAFFDKNLKNGSYLSFVCIIDDKIVSTSGITLYEVPPTAENPNGKTAYLMNMYTLNEFRNKGIATLLLKQIIEEAKSKGFNKIILNASDMGRSIYSKFGFIDLDNEMVYYIK